MKSKSPAGQRLAAVPTCLFNLLEASYTETTIMRGSKMSPRRRRRGEMGAFGFLKKGRWRFKLRRIL